MDAEANYDEERGWTRYNPAAPDMEPVNGLVVRRRRTRVTKEDNSDGNGG